MSELYDTDFVAWAEEQAALLAEGRFESLDVANLIEEVRALAQQHQDALEGHLRVTMIYMLTRTYTKGRRDPLRNWQASIENARREIRRLLRKFPSLRASLEALTRDAYGDAIEDAHDELADDGDEHAPFPEACPWTVEQVMSI